MVFTELIWICAKRGGARIREQRTNKNKKLIFIFGVKLLAKMNI